MQDSTFLPVRWEHSCLFRIRTPFIIKLDIILPLFGFIFSVLWSFFFNFEKSVWTHCQVRNYLPSVSAAFNYPPSSYVWRVCIAFHASVRLLSAFIYYQYNRRIEIKKSNWISSYQSQLSRLSAYCNLFEIISLVLLTNISSKENETAHIISFCLFVFFSILYTSTVCLLHSLMPASEMSSVQKTAWKLKKRSWITHVSSLALCLYFYLRHIKLCEPYVYTMFAFFEYVFILSKMVFHFAMRYEFENYSFKYEKDTSVKAY